MKLATMPTGLDTPPAEPENPLTARETTPEESDTHLTELTNTSEKDEDIPLLWEPPKPQTLWDSFLKTLRPRHIFTTSGFLLGGLFLGTPKKTRKENENRKELQPAKQHPSTKNELRRPGKC